MFKKILCRLIIYYQKNISARFPGKCKFFPTCSNYALISIARFGVIKGLVLSIFRILRCNRFSMGGIDFVPKR